MRNGRGDVTTDTTEIIRIISEYYKYYANELDNQKEMGPFLKTYSLPN